MEALGVPLVEGKDHFFADELWVDVGPAVAHVHFAFQAKDRAAVDRFHAAVLAAGGRDNGAPGERKYHPGYYAAFAFDPDGNNVEGRLPRSAQASADSVHIRWWSCRGLLTFFFFFPLFFCSPVSPLFLSPFSLPSPPLPLPPPSSLLFLLPPPPLPLEPLQSLRNGFGLPVGNMSVAP